VLVYRETSQTDVSEDGGRADPMIEAWFKLVTWEPASRSLPIQAASAGLPGLAAMAES